MSLLLEIALAFFVVTLGLLTLMVAGVLSKISTGVDKAQQAKEDAARLAREFIAKTNKNVN